MTRVAGADEGEGGAGASDVEDAPASAAKDTKRDSERRPTFARSFPRAPELDALVRAFEDGDYRRVRDEAPEVARRAEDPAVRRAALRLRARTDADPLARGLLALTLVLLVFLTVYWARRHAVDAAPSPPPPMTVEHVR